MSNNTNQYGFKRYFVGNFQEFFDNAIRVADVNHQKVIYIKDWLKRNKDFIKQTKAWVKYLKKYDATNPEIPYIEGRIIEDAKKGSVTTQAKKDLAKERAKRDFKFWGQVLLMYPKAVVELIKLPWTIAKYKKKKEIERTMSGLTGQGTRIMVDPIGAVGSPIPQRNIPQQPGPQPVNPQMPQQPQPAYQPGPQPQGTRIIADPIGAVGSPIPQRNIPQQPVPQPVNQQIPPQAPLTPQQEFEKNLIEAIKNFDRPQLEKNFIDVAWQLNQANGQVREFDRYFETLQKNHMDSIQALQQEAEKSDHLANTAAEINQQLLGWFQGQGYTADQIEAIITGRGKDNNQVEPNQPIAQPSTDAFEDFGRKTQDNLEAARKDIADGPGKQM